MHTPVAIVLVVCGTVVAIVPLLVQPHLADAGMLCYLALASAMIGSGIVGSFTFRRPRPARGFEPLPVVPAA